MRWWLLLFLSACGRSQLLVPLLDEEQVEVSADAGPDGGVDAGAGTDAGRDGGADGGADAGRDGGADGGADAGRDAGADGGADAGLDAGADGGADAGLDAGADGGADAGQDAGVDGGADAGQDAGLGADAGRDAGAGFDGGLDAGAGDAGLPPGRCGGAGAARGIDVSVHTALGLPDCSGWGQQQSWLLVRPQFVSSFDTLKKVPRWTSWKLEQGDLGTVARTNAFHQDALLPAGVPQAANADYLRSGYDRGHLCPSADRSATAADNFATFVLTNIVPQTSQSNTGPWLSLESDARALVRAGKNLVVIAGPIFGATRQTIGSGVEVPRSMFKVAVILDGPPDVASVTSTTKVYAAIVPNSLVVSGSWRAFQVTPRTVELQTGLDFLADLPQATQDLLELRLDP